MPPTSLMKEVIKATGGLGGTSSDGDTGPLSGLRSSASEPIDFRLLVENCVDMIALVGPEGRFLYASPSCDALLGWAPEEIVGRIAYDFVLADDLPIVEAGIGRLLARETEVVTNTARSIRRDGTIVWTEVTVRAVRDPRDDEMTGTVLVLRNISRRKELEEQLADLAHKDGLTGLANRRAFDEALDREWRRTLRDGAQMSLLLLDIDHFKNFNDQHGHQVGDDCLRAVSATVAGKVRRSSDTVARYGGEEIAVILPGVDMTGAAEVAEAMRVAVEALRLVALGEQGTTCLTVSVGVATALARVGGTMTMPAGLLSAADSALYKAKQEGRNRIAVSLLLAPASGSGGI